MQGSKLVNLLDLHLLTQKFFAELLEFFHVTLIEELFEKRIDRLSDPDGTPERFRQTHRGAARPHNLQRGERREADRVADCVPDAAGEHRLQFPFR